MEQLPLKEWRLRKFWSLRKLASESHVSIDAIRRAENGAKVWEITQRKLASALDLKPEEIAEFAPASEVVTS